MSLDAQILMALRSSNVRPVSGTELSTRLGISRAAIWARIEELRKLGYDIEATPHIGYILRGSPDVLHADDLLSRLPKDRIIGRDIRVFQETTSTNDIVEKLALDGVKEGVAVFADSQTKGRGRLGRQWVSPGGKGLWLSVLLRPSLRPSSAMQITIAAATAMARALQSHQHSPPEIKWPNDILLRGRKVAGILTEMSADIDHIKHVILGIGVNVNFDESDFPPALSKMATSLKIESGVETSRPDLATAILMELEQDYARIRAGQFQSIVAEWARQCTTLGRQVVIQVGTRRVQGRAESLDADGALLVRTQHGHLERIIGGDVTIEKQP